MTITQRRQERAAKTLIRATFETICAFPGVNGGTLFTAFTKNGFDLATFYATTEKLVEWKLVKREANGYFPHG